MNLIDSILRNDVIIDHKLIKKKKTNIIIYILTQTNIELDIWEEIFHLRNGIQNSICKKRTKKRKESYITS